MGWRWTPRCDNGDEDVDMGVDVNDSGSLRQRASFSHDQESHRVDSSSLMNNDLAFLISNCPDISYCSRTLNMAPTGTKLDLLRSTARHSAQTSKTFKFILFSSILILLLLPQQFFHHHHGRSVYLRLKQMPIRIPHRSRTYILSSYPKCN